MQVGWICVKHGLANAAPFLYARHVAVVFDRNGHWLLYANGTLVGEKKPDVLMLSE